MERKNLKVPNFPTWEELETEQANGELESYVEQVKKRISEVREKRGGENNVESEKKVEDDVISSINPVADYEIKSKEDVERERERERESKFRPNSNSYTQKSPT